MKKFALTIFAAVSTLASTVPVANAAGTATSGFAVTATLTSYCTISAFSGGGLAFATVQAFTAPSIVTSTATVKCTRGLTAPTMVFDTVNGTTAGTGSAPTGAGVLPNGLYYTLAAVFGSLTTGLAPSNAGLNGQDSDDRILTVTGTIPAQAGAISGLNTHNRSVTITF